MAPRRRARKLEQPPGATPIASGAHPLLDDFVLGLARRAEPRILFLPTASGDETARSMPSARDDAVQELRRVQRLRRGGDHRLAGGTRGRG